MLCLLDTCRMRKLVSEEWSQDMEQVLGMLLPRVLQRPSTQPLEHACWHQELSSTADNHSTPRQCLTWLATRDSKPMGFDKSGFMDLAAINSRYACRVPYIAISLASDWMNDAKSKHNKPDQLAVSCWNTAAVRAVVYLIWLRIFVFGAAITVTVALDNAAENVSNVSAER